MTNPLSLFATCAPGLEPLLAEEVRALGVGNVQQELGGVAFETDREGLWRANLELGLALNVLWRFARFSVHDFKELEKRLARVDWAPLGDTPVRLQVTSKGSRLYHTGAIGDRVQAALPGTASEREPVRLLVRLQRTRCTLALDTSGDPLHKRGYRLASGAAPLREDIARALLRVARYQGQCPLLDPLAGSGTLPIEAALLATGRAPGLCRRFAFERLPDFDEEAWSCLRQRAKDAVQPAAAPILGSDRDADSMARARQNAGRAGVAGAIDWRACSVSEASAEAPEDGLVATNPPYGRRMGDARQLRALYAALGRMVRDLPGDWQAGVITPSAKLAGTTGLQLRSALLTDMGGLKVRLYTSEEHG